MGFGPPHWVLKHILFTFTFEVGEHLSKERLETTGAVAKRPLNTLILAQIVVETNQTVTQMNSWPVLQVIGETLICGFPAFVIR